MAATPQRIMVFGGTGTIGAACCARLWAEGRDVAVFSRRAEIDIPGVEAFSGDIADAGDVSVAVAAWRPDAVLQLAACLQQDAEMHPALGVSVNVSGAVNVLLAAAEGTVTRFVFGSSIAAYGARDDLMREDDAPAGSISLYGLQKLMGEKLGRRHAEAGGFSFAALRYSGIFGPQRPSGAGMALARHEILNTANGADVRIDFVSGEETCHLTYIDDAVEATMRALFAADLRYDVYNVGGPEGNFLSLRALHDLVRGIVPSAGDAVFTGQARSAGPLDLGRAREGLGYQPQFGVEDALRIMLDTPPVKPRPRS